MSKIKLAVLVGGKSAEHEISLISGSNVIKAVDKEKYEVIIIGIDKTGRFFLISDQSPFFKEKPPATIEYASEKAIVFPAGENGKIVGLTDRNIDIKADVIFPVLHGTFAEDCTVQGLLELSNVPYVGANVLGSAVGMDKDVMKRLMRDAGIPSAKFITLRAQEADKLNYETAKKELGPIIFVKPANLGSSVGIHKAKNVEEFIKSVKDAFLYDNKILLEEYIPGPEIECSVLGN